MKGGNRPRKVRTTSAIPSHRTAGQARSPSRGKSCEKREPGVAHSRFEFNYLGRHNAMNNEGILLEPRSEITERESGCDDGAAACVWHSAGKQEHAVVESSSQPVPVPIQVLGDPGAIGKSKQDNIHGGALPFDDWTTQATPP